MRIYVGIDNGISGGLAAVDQDSTIVGLLPMPTRGKAKGNEVNALAVSQWIADLHTEYFPGAEISIVLETPGKFSNGVQAIASMFDSYGALRAVCEVRGYRHHRITPQQWQKAMLPGCKKGDTKPAAIQRAKQLWPDQSWLATERCKTPNLGLIDAALMAEYARRERL